ncbi:PEP/pyruvate-binding domain-containing protein [bacterium]|nr:PEP/pyruvate-binding domain-containing protein [bacterium]
MLPSRTNLSTGLPGLDKVLKGLLAGDNVVWQLDSIDDYQAFVEPFVQTAVAQERTVIYFRFAKHQPLVADGLGAQICELHPEAGFETFISEVRHTIRAAGRGAYYVFDCLSDLAVDWYSDQMLGNFFMLTCPYLFDMETIAYFGLLRNNHSSHATEAISNTTQLLLDVLRSEGRLYVHPLKVQHRYSPTMHMVHIWEDDEFTPVTQSATISHVMTGMEWLQLDSMSFQLGVWNRAFLQALEIMNPVHGESCDLVQANELQGRLLRMAVSRDERMLELIRKYLSLGEVLDVGKRMIGTGLIGGKTVGMLLARAILKHSDERWEQLLEPHDSFYIGSDVFYTYLVRNGIWWVREGQRDPENYLDDASMARQRMLTGTFPESLVKQFEQMLDYFGQSPYIVRSSSLLEDAYGNAFAGKYDSVFCVNQGPRQQRLDDFLAAVRTIYASSMSDKALTYRAQRGLLDRDEQMALLVQRVSGDRYGELFYPQIAGVGLSYNPYVWSSYIDPQAGVLRLVFGLGTRAVDRSDDDYTRVVALNAAERRPESDFDEVRQYSQRRVDVLDVEANHHASYDLAEVVQASGGLPLELLMSRDQERERRAAQRGMKVDFPWVLTFERLFKETNYVDDMRRMLQTLQEAYEYPVEVEFTTNFLADGSYKVNLLQCRPLQVKGGGPVSDPPTGLDPAQTVLEAHGAVIGQSRVTSVDRIIYVSPSVYGQLPIPDRYEIARLIGRLCHLKEPGEPRKVLLMGPGRWGTTTPSLGVPVSFSDISTVSFLCEIVAMREDLVPDMSLGTHFFNELIEMDILYMALFPTRAGNYLNRTLLERLPSRLSSMVPEAVKWPEAVRVIEAADLPHGRALHLNANAPQQRVVCYLEP